VLQPHAELRAEDATGLTPEELARAQELARWIAAAARHHIVRARCLHQSLALHAWLTHEGIPSRLYVGVRKVDSQLRAHAWVAVGETILIDAPDEITTFTPLRGALTRPDGWFQYCGIQGKAVR